MQFEGAYNLLTDAKDIEGMPTVSMYNAIMAGYFREASFSVLFIASLVVHLQKPTYTVMSKIRCSCNM